MILILDIGKTNKKCFVFDEDYRIVFEKTATLPETTDEDGDPCEDLFLLKKWVTETLLDILEDERFDIEAVNCTAYGASFVHLGADGEPLTPLYNYLKPFPADLRKQFFDTYGSEAKIALETASPVLGHLNSGLQLYWLKHHKSLVFKQIKWSLHLPQYAALLTSEGLSQNVGRVLNPSNVRSEITSIGCHTMLWDFRKNDYHDWVKAEGIAEKFPLMVKSSPVPRNSVSGGPERSSGVHIGTGLHDSSAALIPYLICFAEPFVLLSTGTWCISLNPFNDEPLTAEELQNDCLCYLTFEGKSVKAARYFGGHEHEQAVQRIAAQHGAAVDFYKNAGFVPRSPAEADYFAFMRQLVEKQAVSTRLAIGRSAVRRIFVDGGFSKNETYMTLLAAAFPQMEVFAAEVAQATALGAALALHRSWNPKPLPQNLISLKKSRMD